MAAMERNDDAFQCRGRLACYHVSDKLIVYVRLCVHPACEKENIFADEKTTHGRPEIPEIVLNYAWMIT